MRNSADPDQTAIEEHSDQDLHCVFSGIQFPDGARVFSKFKDGKICDRIK